jgi:protein tyrosine/serine phosphatase
VPQFKHAFLSLLTTAVLLAVPLTLAQAILARAEQAATVQRPAAWAAPIAVAGVPNLYRVSENVYRSAQPTAEGFKTLAGNPGIKTVVSLRAFDSDQAIAAGTGIKLVRIKIHTWHIETEDVVTALAEIRRAEAQGPVLLHCQHGADRTGLITAIYRVLYQGWSKDDARDEMLNGNFGYHAIWGNIPRYLSTVDLTALKEVVEKAIRK